MVRRGYSSQPCASSSNPHCGCTLSKKVIRRNGMITASSKLALKRSKMASRKPKANFLSLPDDVISHVYCYLNPSDTSGLLDKPRHAFALALTNTRLLKIFCTHVTRVTPELESLQLNSKHVFSVVSLAGEHVCELNIPASAWHILPYLPALCPKLEKLSLKQELYSSSPEFFLKCAQLLMPQLRSLSVTTPICEMCEVDVPVNENLLVEGKRPVTPLWEIASTFVPPPPELILKGFSCHFIQFLMPILYEPPKILYLQLTDTTPECIADLIPVLQRACPKMEEVTVIKGYSEAQLWEHTHTEKFLDEALQLLDTPRQNEKSKCMKMTIEKDFKDLLGSAHPKAVLSVQKVREIFVREGNQVFAKALPLLSDYLNLDLSRLEEVYTSGCLRLDSQWVERLSSVHLSLLIWHRPFKKIHDDLTRMFQNVDVIEVHAWNVPRAVKWKSLRSVSEVRIVGRSCNDLDKHTIPDTILRLVHLLRHFRGSLISLHNCPTPRIRSCDHTNLQRHKTTLIDAIGVFEGRGGDASMVKAWMSRL